MLCRNCHFSYVNNLGPLSMTLGFPKSHVENRRLLSNNDIRLAMIFVVVDLILSVFYHRYLGVGPKLGMMTKSFLIS